MHVFRRIVLPISYLVVLLIIAVTLSWLAFKPQENDSVGGAATGEVLPQQATVTRGDVTNTLTFDGSIEVEPSKEVKATKSGVLVRVFSPAGSDVKKGARLFQIRSEGEAPDDPGPASGADGRAGDSSGGAGEGAPADVPAPRPRFIDVVAPADGVVADYAIEEGDEVSNGAVVTSLEQKAFRAVASIEPVQLYRIPDMPDTATVTITDGPQPFECRGLRLNQASGNRGAGGAAGGSGGSSGSAGGATEEAPVDEGEDDSGGSGGGSGPSLSCEVPDDVTVYNGLSMSLEIKAGSATDVLTVPATAVRGTTGEGSVWVIDEAGEQVETKVEIGLSDGEMVEIVKGLDEGQTIAAYVPGAQPEVNPDEGFDEQYVGEGL
ncbi:hypothetical protein [Brevibacterium otitidis]|uniref:CzcB-like C-terminal circularly permuted SH3-like domain-containing protein n=1 Tax=Brevibacterium otitidis TaxID=53364 RepID=A0ABV5WZ35_9MICO|nr:hypothetical protein GCM10023233_26510 [Brevibacterium otitidis]